LLFAIECGEQRVLVKDVEFSEASLGEQIKLISCAG
jgi:hypothetical protein